MYAEPFAVVESRVKPERIKNRDRQRSSLWWRLGRSGNDWKQAAHGALRTVFTPRVSKHRLFVWVEGAVLPDSAVVAFARDDDYFFGILHSRFHEVWALAQGTQLREKESGFRYTPTTCFETFPFPEAGKHAEAISAAAKALNELRERWLNPPEWTKTELLEFPGTPGGPWSRYLKGTTVHYPRVVPNDAECAAKLKARTLTQLYNERPTWLDLAHKKLDAAVAAAYGWPADLSEDAILEKLLQLNLARAAAQQPAVSAKKSRRASADQHQGQLF